MPVASLQPLPPTAKGPAPPCPPPYRPGLDAAAAHAALLAAVAAMQRAESCAALWFADIRARGLYRSLGYSSMEQYAQVALRLSPAKTAQFMRLSERLRELPALRDALAAGRLGWTKARVVAQVATPRTQQQWVAQAESLPRAQLEARIAAQRARRRAGAGGGDPSAVALPVTVSVRFAPEQYARWLALIERLHRQRRAPPAPDRADLLLAALDALARECARPREDAAAAPPHRVVMFRCEACGRTHVETPGGPRPVSPAAADAAACDARIERAGRSRATIPPAVRRAVLARDRHRCQAPGCRHTRFLEVHHRVARADGGTHAPANLVTLCSACHRLWHERALAGGGSRAP